MRKKAAGTMQEEGAKSSGSIKVKVKTRWGGKTESTTSVMGSQPTWYVP